MKSHTIAEINSKVWYRLCKVFFILTFSIIELAIIAAGIQVSTYHFDPMLSSVHCDDNRVLNLADQKIILDSEYITNSDDRKIRSLCAFNANDPININHNSLVDAMNQNSTKKNYQFVPAYLPIIWRNILAYWLMGTAIVIIFEEFIRRIFYYISLGKLYPDKA